MPEVWARLVTSLLEPECCYDQKLVGDYFPPLLLMEFIAVAALGRRFLSFGRMLPGCLSQATV